MEAVLSCPPKGPACLTRYEGVLLLKRQIQICGYAVDLRRPRKL